MISSVVREVSGKLETLKFSTRAQARVERALGMSIQGVLTGLERNEYGVDAVSEILAASWNDGRGTSVEIVYDLIDEIGFKEAGVLVSELFKAALAPTTGDTGARAEKKQ